MSRLFRELRFQLKLVKCVLLTINNSNELPISIQCSILEQIFEKKCSVKWVLLIINNSNELSISIRCSILEQIFKTKRSVKYCKTIHWLETIWNIKGKVGRQCLNFVYTRPCKVLIVCFNTIQLIHQLWEKSEEKCKSEVFRLFNSSDFRADRQPEGFNFNFNTLMVGFD